jgi:PAS domain S-box-containing protein
VLSWAWGRKAGRKAGGVLTFLAVVLIFATLVSLPTFGQEVPQKHLLVLQSYHRGYKWTDDITLGIEAALQGDGKTVSVHYEYMDTKRISDPAHFKLLYETYRHKFSKSEFDAIIAADNDAFDFLLSYRDDLFPGTPVVFCGVNYFEPSRLEGKQLFTGVNEEADIKATLDLALKLHPRTRRIVVINDTTTTGRIMHREIVKLLPAYRGRVDFTFLEEVEMPEILAAVQKLDSDSLVFYTLFHRDKAGKFFTYDASISLIAEKCPVPIYGVWDFTLGLGVVGGKLTSGYYQGETAGAMAARILHGVKVEKIPIVMKSPNRYMFDYRQLQRFGLAYFPLPEGSILINKPLPRYSVPDNVFWGAIVVVAGLVVIILLLLRNMAIRKEAEKELRDAALKYRIVADNTYDWEFWLSPEGNFIYTSPSCECITGYNVGEFLADPDLRWQIVHPGDRERLDGHWHEVARKMLPGELQFRIIRPDGSVRWIDHICLPVFDDNGQFLGTRGNNRDITERRVADETLRESERRVRSLLETIPMGVEECDAGGVVTLTNAAFSKLTGYRQDEIIGTRIWDFLEPGPQKEFLPAYLQHLVHDQPPPTPFLGKLVTKGGRVIEIQIDWTYKRNENGLVIGLVCIVSDITERKEMELMKDEMISAVSHEMRTPLTAMLGYIEFILENRLDEAQTHEYLGIVHHETERLNELISNFLDLQRIKARQAIYSFAAVAVQPLLEEAAALFAGASKIHRITLHPAMDLPPVLADEARLHQVLNNLLSNAVKYSPKGGEINLGARRDKETVILWVKDEGLGIATELQERIFDKFYQVDSTDRRQSGGTGLGLPLAREIVHAHGGRIWVESTAGQGSTFYVSLPVMKEAAGAANRK